MNTAAGAPLPGLAVFLACIVIERLAELVLSRRNARRLRARGAREHSPGHFPVLIALHVLWPLLLTLEVVRGGARPGALWPLWLGLFLAAQLLRGWTLRTLGDRWTVRILVVPGEALVRDGPYRFLRHPNYVAVAAELIAGPLLFGAWRTALCTTVLNALALGLRIPAEERALGLRPPGR